MNKNFRIINSILVKTDNESFDLHNNYDFLGYRKLSNQMVILSWIKAKGDWVSSDSAELVEFIFCEVERFETSEKLAIESKSSDTIEDIGYLESKDKDVSCLKREENANGNDQLIFRFDDDEWIRVFSKDVLVTTINHLS